MTRLVIAAAIIAVGVALSGCDSRVVVDPSSGHNIWYLGPSPSAAVAPVGDALEGRVDAAGLTPSTGEQGSRHNPSGAIGTVLFGGRASWVRASLGPRYLALRLPRGTLTRICGKACVLRVTTDYGPSSRIRPRRVADLSAADFRVVCGPLRLGVCRVSVELVDLIALPATDRP